MKLLFAIISLFLYLNSNQSFADNHDQVIFWDQSSGGWDIYIDTTIDYGCFAHMEWKGNTQMRFGFDPTVDSMYITISDGDWRSLQVGKDYDIQIEFDNSQPWTTTAQAINLDGINSLYFTFYEQDFIAEFAKKHSIYVTYNNKEIAYLDLKGSYEAVIDLAACQDQLDSYYNNGTEDPFNNNSSKSDDPFI